MRVDCASILFMLSMGSVGEGRLCLYSIYVIYGKCRGGYTVPLFYLCYLWEV